MLSLKRDLSSAGSPFDSKYSNSVCCEFGKGTHRHTHNMLLLGKCKTQINKLHRKIKKSLPTLQCKAKMLIGRRQIWDKRTQKRFLPQRLVGPRSNSIGCHNIPPSYYLYTTGCQYFKRTKQDCSPTKEPSHLAQYKWPLHEKNDLCT